jgi:concanavalin A-like lectin/glucanase superfamily protein
MRKELIATMMVVAVLWGGWSPTYAADPTLAGWWKLDDGAGTIAADASGKSVDGELFGDPAWDTEGVIGGSLLFDGADDYMFIDGHFELPEYTMAVWFRVDEPGQRDILSAYAVGVQHGILLELQAAGTLRFLHRFPLGTGGGNNIYTTTTYSDGLWYHAAFMKSTDEISLYINGELVDSMADNSTFDPGDSFGLAVGVLDDERGADRLFLGAMDDVRVHNRALSQAEVQAIMRGAGYDTAVDPIPAHEANDVPLEVVLEWGANDAAVAHDVYFGSVFDDVNDADRADPRGVLASQGQTATTFDLGLLEFGQTYYWRIDEVNAPPNSVIFKGDIWSFTAEPLGYPIEGVVTTSNGTPGADGDPENTVNGSGLNDEDQHSTDSSDMWLANPPVGEPLYIQFEFDRVYKLHEMLVWNYNVGFELVLGFGLKDVTVEYSVDGADWMVLSDAVFAQGTAKEGYAANTTIDFGGVSAQYVKLSVNSGHGVMGQFGLSEVRFLYTPVQARMPEPADVGADVAVVGASLNWRPGREAVTHQVYLSADKQAVIDGTALADTLDAPGLDADGLLELAQTYYWKVDEVNEAETASVWEGDVWSFATQTAIVVDDFEAYNDEDNVIYETWIDGWVNDTGSTVGYLQAPFAEQTIVHGGGQSLPLFFENAGGAAVSEATRSFETPQDWTKYGIKGLTLWFYGDAATTATQMYVKVNGTRMDYDGAADNLQQTQWQVWYIDLADLAGANLGQVTELTLGLEGGEGSLLFDDITLSPAARELVTPTEPEATDLMAHYAFEGNADDSVGVYSGTLVGEPQFAPGQDGQAIKLNGVADYVHVESSFDLPAYSASLWFRVDGGTAERDVFSVYNEAGDHGILLEVTAAGTLRYLHRAPLGTSTGTDLRSDGVYDDGAWYHAAMVKSADTTTLYVNGMSVGSAADENAFGAPLQNLALGVLKHDDLIRYFPGAIDEVYLYGRALSQAEVAWLAGRTDPFDK